MKKIVCFTALSLALLFVFASCTANTATQPDETAFEKTINYEVVDINGNSEPFQLKTIKGTVGEALEEAGVLAGEEGDYGLYITSVNGIIADYNIDGTYWAFYIDGEMSMKGADQTPIEEGKVYSFKVQK